MWINRSTDGRQTREEATKLGMGNGYGYNHAWDYTRLLTAQQAEA
jgi:hypothetical protein